MKLTLEIFMTYMVDQDKEMELTARISSRIIDLLHKELVEENPGSYEIIEQNSEHCMTENPHKKDFNLYYFVDEQRNIRLATIPVNF